MWLRCCLFLDWPLKVIPFFHISPHFNLSILLFFWLTSLLYLSNSFCRGCTTHSSATVTLYVLDGVGYFCILSSVCHMPAFIHYGFQTIFYGSGSQLIFFFKKGITHKQRQLSYNDSAIFSPHYLLLSPPTFAEALPPHGPTYCHIFFFFGVYAAYWV